jgi:hypothetical protein
MGFKYDNATSLSSGLHIESRSPVDDRVYFETVEDAYEAIATNKGYKKIPDGTIVMITDNPGGDPAIQKYNEYIWAETENGLFDEPVEDSTYDPNYKGRKFNLVPLGPGLSIDVFVPEGSESITIPERYLPMHLRNQLAANVIIYEGGEDSNPYKKEPVMPDSVALYKHDLTGKIHLVIYIKPAYEEDITVTIKAI